jgi:hypothetical protein
MGVVVLQFWGGGLGIWGLSCGNFVAGWLRIWGLLRFWGVLGRKADDIRVVMPTGRPIDGRTEISVTGGLQILWTCDARIYARVLALGGLGPRGELSFDWSFFVLSRSRNRSGWPEDLVPGPWESIAGPGKRFEEALGPRTLYNDTATQNQNKIYIYMYMYIYIYPLWSFQAGA